MCDMSMATQAHSHRRPPQAKRSRGLIKYIGDSSKNNTSAGARTTVAISRDLATTPSTPKGPWEAPGGLSNTKGRCRALSNFVCNQTLKSCCTGSIRSTILKHQNCYGHVPASFFVRLIHRTLGRCHGNCLPAPPDGFVLRWAELVYSQTCPQDLHGI